MKKYLKTVQKGLITSGILMFALFAFAGNVHADTADVSDINQLSEALASTTVDVININSNIDTPSKLIVGHAVTINGGSHTIKFTGDTEGWNGNYVFEAYDTIDVSINNIKLTGADGALLVNGSTLVLSGNIDVSGNEFGGIEVSKGSAPNNSSLTATDASLVNTTEAYGLPTIWVVNGQGELVGGPSTTNTTIKADQTQYYLIANNSVKVFIDTSKNNEFDEGELAFSTIQEAVDRAAEGDTIKVTAGTYAENLTINHAITLNGANVGISGSSESRVAETGISNITVTASNVIIDGFLFTNHGPQIRVNDDLMTRAGIVVQNNIFKDYADVAIPTNNAGNIVIQRNLFTNPSALGEAIQIKASDIELQGCNGSTVSNNVFTTATNNGGSDINLSCTGSDSSDVTISGNTSTGNTGGSSFVGFSGVNSEITVSDNILTTSGSSIFFFGNVSGDVHINNNTVTNGASNAVSIHGADFIPEDVANTGTFTITGNTFTGNTNGISVASSAMGLNGHIIAHNNNFSGNVTAGITNSSTDIIDATENWWGSANGAGNTVSENVNTDPWYVNSTRATLSNESTLPDDTGNATVTETNKSVVVVSSTQPLVIAAGGTEGATIDFGSLTSTNGGVTTADIPHTTINSSVANIVIPETTISSDDTNWDGVVSLPKIVASVTPNEVSGKTNSNVKSIEIGSESVKLLLGLPAKLFFSGLADSKVGWSQGGEFHEITALCNSTDAPTLDEGADCKINSGSDLIVWTRHFTTFTTYTQTSNSVSSSSTSGSHRSVESSTATSVTSDTTAPQIGEVLGAEAISPEIQAQINSIKSQLVTLIGQLIVLLQAEIAAQS